MINKNLTVQETADILGLSANQVYKLLREGKLPADHWGDRWILNSIIITVYKLMHNEWNDNIHRAVKISVSLLEDRNV